MTHREMMLEAFKTFTREDLEEYAVFTSLMMMKVGEKAGAQLIMAECNDNDGYTVEHAEYCSNLSLKLRSECHRIQREAN